MLSFLLGGPSRARRRRTHEVRLRFEPLEQRRLLSAVPFGVQQPISTDAQGAESVASADLDGDGDMDILSASFLDDTIAWYENTAGDGSAFTPHPISTAADGARYVTTADLDGDGDLDVLSAAFYDDEITWYENTAGDASAFTPHTITTAADGAVSVAVGDVDGDGDIDVLSASQYDDKIAWYENTAGDASAFTPHTISTDGDEAFAVAVGDVDGDGDLDVLSASRYDGEVVWHENTAGDASAFSPHTITSAAEGAVSLAVGDLDGDGDLDVLSSSLLDDEISWYENTAGDGSVFVTDGIPAMATTSILSVNVADVDADGDLDVLAALFANDKVAWFENTAGDASNFMERTISTAVSQAFSVAATDIDGDGDLDVMSASYADNKIAWYENETIHRSAVFPEQVPISTAANGPFSVAVGDVDGDGDLDVLSASQSDDKIAWYENTAGDGSAFSPHPITTTANGATSVTAADVDGDGDLDVLSASLSDNKIAWYENTAGDGSAFTPHTITTAADRAVSVAVADVDGDGDTDVLSASRDDNKIAWYENTAGDGSAFTPHTITTDADSARSVTVGDVDGDGDTDVLSASAYDDKIAWYENTAGDGSAFTPHTITTTADGASFVAVADVDGDGDTDVLSASFSDSKIAWYENIAGDGSAFSPHPITTAADGATSVTVADLDGDGDTDVLSASNIDDKIAWYENTAGDGFAFTPHTISTAADGARWVTVGDLDGDGDSDALSASFTDDKIAWYENRGGQFALDTTDTAPATLEDGQVTDLLEIVMHHRGRAGDHDEELTSLDLLFEEMPGDVLLTAEANALIENLHIFRDTGNGTFEPGDTLVTTVSDLALAGGVQTVGFVDGDPNVQLAFGSEATFFVVVEMTVDASTQTPNSFQVTHLTESTSTAEDAEADLPLSLEFADNVASALLTVEADTTGPTVVDIQVSGSGWGQDFLDFLAAPGYAIPVGDGEQLRTLGWQGIDEIHVVFSEEVVVALGDLSLVGVNVPMYAVTGLTTGPGPHVGTFLATWTLQDPIEVDKLRIDLPDSIQDLVGNALDGEWDNPTHLNDPMSSSYPSGDTVAGGNFAFRFNVVEGDINGDGEVGGPDYTLWANGFGLPLDGNVIHADLNADGDVGGPDYTLWANRFGHALPDPTAPTIVDVLVSGSGWGQDFLDFLAAPGYAIPVGDGEQLRTLGWRGIDEIHVVFSEEVIVALGDLSLVGVNVPLYTVTGLTTGPGPQAGTFLATWTLQNPIEVDKVRIDLPDTIQDLAFNALDGEWDNPTDLADADSDSYPSGDTVAGGNFAFRFNVVEGDINGDGEVGGPDYTLWANGFGLPLGGDVIHADLNADGDVGGPDYTLWANRFGHALPGSEPLGPAFASASASSGSASQLVQSLQGEQAVDRIFGRLSNRSSRGHLTVDRPWTAGELLDLALAESSDEWRWLW